TFVANVTYYNDYPIAINNVSFGDQAFLDKVESVDYYTVDGDRYFQFNFLNNENVLLTGTGQFAQAWNGFALWNLTTNELIVYNKALALTYLDITEDREIFAYLYLPGIPMDDVLAVSGHFNYRYGYENFLGTQKYEEWQTSLFALEKDRESYGTQSIFEGALPQWSYDAAEYSLAALAVGSVLSMIPGLQVIGVPLLFASAALMVSSVATAIEHVTTGLISEIETITPSTTLKTTLNNHYTLASGALTVLPSNATVEKLFLGLYTKPGTNCVEPDADTLVYTEITWVTNGQVYTLDENYIDSGAVLDVDDQAALPVEGTNTLDDFFASLGEYGIYFIILAVIVVGALVLKYLDSGLTSLSRITKDKRKLFFFALIIATILIILGVIRL
ncbi:MAG: hypothetical protein KKG64_03750, partial [Firmicutes bacterium]|nr:hypothetical protein [Bacillota bacterium]